MGYSAPDVFTGSSHAQYARNVLGSFGCRRVASIRRSTYIVNSYLLTIHSDKTSRTLRGQEIGMEVDNERDDDEDAGDEVRNLKDLQMLERLHFC